ncbi:Hypothetical protein CINCED_3A004832 [Cinara cedri]|uniref:NEDD4 family-interacting protein 1-like n=1 Tax=Cinara cedri TaxID=506608 RepID=A0A5E4M0W0_9HEMI|nr:Hypothetical protein CINCED_3A004832 [Cinara cedri]
MNQQTENHIMDIPPPVYSNVATTNQTDASENENTEVIQTIPVHPPVSSQGRVVGGPPSIGTLPQEMPAQTLTVLTIDAAPNPCEIDTNLLGTDYMFLTAFLVALLFNWVGFLVLMCLCQTVAARYGALAGFGLSLAKWTMIVKRNTEMAELSSENHSNTWLWWLVMAFGFLICIRAVIQYMNIKRGWRLLSVPAQERVLYFY